MKLGVASKGALYNRVAELVIEMGEMKAKKITLETQTAEQCDAELERGPEQPHVEAKRESWEVKYADIDDYDRMPETSSALYKWQNNQLTGFDGKIKKKIAANKGSTKWRGRRAQLVACIVKKNIDMWEEKYAEFDDYDGMPETSSAAYVAK